MPNVVELGVIAVLSYLIGSVPFGYLVARWRGVDIFKAGSGNIGATNVGRVLGRKFGVLVFVLDFLKGAIPTLIATFVLPQQRDVAGVTAGLSAFLGHLFPIYLRFRGGKGVATGAGVVCVLVPLPAVAALLTWAVVVAVTRIVSLASLVAALALCVAYLLLTAAPFEEKQLVLTVFCLIATVLVFVKHRSNIGRLLAGTEPRLGKSSS